MRRRGDNPVPDHGVNVKQSKIVVIALALPATAAIAMNTNPASGQGETEGRPLAADYITNPGAMKLFAPKLRISHAFTGHPKLRHRYLHERKLVLKVVRKQSGRQAAFSAVGRNIVTNGVQTRHGVRPARRGEVQRSLARLQSAYASATAPKVSTAPTGAPASSTSSPVGGGSSVDSTAYCGGGTMANGQSAAAGSVAVPQGTPLGGRYRIMSGPLAGQEVVASDYIGSGSQFDIYMNDCSAATAYGRQPIQVAPVG